MMERLVRYLEKNVKAKFFVKMGLLLVYTLVFCVLAYFVDFNPTESYLDDVMLQQGTENSQEVLIIAITQEDLDYYQEDASVLAARIANKLNQKTKNKPITINLDIPLSTISDEAYVLIQEAASYGNVLLPVEFDVDDAIYIDDFGNVKGDLSTSVYSSTNTYRCNNALSGHAIHVTDKDGILRRGVFDVTVQDTTYPSIAYVNYERYCEEKGIAPHVYFMVDNCAYIKYATRALDDSSNGIGISNTAKGFLEDDAQNENGLNCYENKIVYIGYYASNLDQGYITSIDHDNVMHTAEVDAQITNALINNNTAMSTPRYIQVIGFAFATILFMIVLNNRNSLVGICFIFIYILLNRITTVAMYGVGYVSYNMPHYLSAVLSVIVLYGFNLITNLYVKNLKTKDILGKYVDRNIANNIIEGQVASEDLFKLRDSSTKSVEIAVLFADIRGFTSLSESLSPEELVPVLNKYLSMMAECIEKYGGTLDKFIGDCVMAYWGAPDKDPEAAYHATLCAFEMQRRSKLLNKQFKKHANRDIQIGIGINYGRAVVGSIGSAERMNFTALGDVVNTAERMESIAPGGCIYVSEAVRRQINQHAEYEPLPEKIKLKGKAEPQPVFSVLSISLDEVKKKENSNRQEGVPRYRRRALLSIILNVLLIGSNAFLILQGLREYTYWFANYYVLISAFLCCVASALSIPYAVVHYKRADGICVAPKFVTAIRLAALVSGLYNMGVYTIFHLVPMLHGETSEISLPGGIYFYLVLPVVYLLLFLVLENKQKINIGQGVVAVTFNLILRVLGYVVCISTDNILESNFELYYQVPGAVFSVLAEVALVIFFSILGTILYRVTEKRVQKESLIDRIWERFKTGKLSAFLQQERVKSSFLLVFDLVTLVAILMNLVEQAMGGWGNLLNFVSLLSILVAICNFIIIIYDINAIIKNKEDKDQAFYRYAIFGRNYYWQLIVATVVVLVINNDDISLFLGNVMGGNLYLYLIGPVISLIIFLLERLEHKWWSCLLFSLPALAVQFVYVFLNDEYILSQTVIPYATIWDLALNSAGLVVLALVEFVLSFLAVRIFKKEADNPSITICGGRQNSPTFSNSITEFGLETECLVYRNKEYAIVFNAGSGLKQAHDPLYGCTSVDIVLTNRNLDYRLGFLLIKELSQYAKIRVISPYEYRDFEERGNWYRKIKKKNWIQVDPGTPYRLNEDYTLNFVFSDRGYGDCAAIIDGEYPIIYTPSLQSISKLPIKKLQRLKMLICDSVKETEEASYLTVDNSIPNLIISGYPSEMEDREILDYERKGKKIFEKIVFAREDVKVEE